MRQSSRAKAGRAGSVQWHPRVIVHQFRLYLKKNGEGALACSVELPQILPLAWFWIQDPSSLSLLGHPNNNPL